MDDFSDGKVKKIKKKRINDDGYIEEEVWFQKWDGKTCIEEKGLIYINNGKMFFSPGGIEKGYIEQTNMKE